MKIKVTKYKTEVDSYELEDAKPEKAIKEVVEENEEEQPLSSLGFRY